jgi:HEAT repeat protein
MSSWRVWWELNHDRYVPRARPRVVGDETLTAVVLPSLLHALENSGDPDVLSAALVALGKTGVDDAEVLAAIRSGLARSHVEVREAAALALGLTGSPEVVPDLDALLRDTRDGRRLGDQGQVDDRVRTFAAYALSLVAHRSDDADVDARVLDSLLAALEDGRIRDRDVLTGVLNGIRLIGPEPGRGGAHKRVLWRAVAALERFLERRFRDQTVAVQSHALTALAALVGRGDGVDQRRAKALVLERLEQGRAEPTVLISATIALGRLLQPADEEAYQVLARRIALPPDPMVRNLGMIALGEIGGEASLEHLRRAYGQTDRVVQAWAAIGLGLLAYHAPDAGADPQQTSATDLRALVGALLLGGLRENRNREVLAATAIGLGLAGCVDAAPALRKMLEDSMNLDDFAGHLCIALAMLGDTSAIPQIRSAASGVDQPVLFGHAARALAGFGRVDASSAGVEVLRAGGGSGPFALLRLSAAAQAVGALRNPADVATLAQLVGPTDRRERATSEHLRRAFAAAALGSVVDRDPLGFGVRVADGMNYTARAQTISNGLSGILDIF